MYVCITPKYIQHCHNHMTSIQIKREGIVHQSQHDNVCVREKDETMQCPVLVCHHVCGYACN